jgi:hypothetical protein
MINPKNGQQGAMHMMISSLPPSSHWLQIGARRTDTCEKNAPQCEKKAPSWEKNAREKQKSKATMW